MLEYSFSFEVDELEAAGFEDLGVEDEEDWFWEEEEGLGVDLVC